MKSRALWMLPLLVLALASASCGHSGGAGDAMAKNSDGLPTVDEVIARFVEVTGGESAWESVESYRADGKLEMPAMGLSASVVMMGNTSGDSVMEVEIPGAGKQAQGVSGDVVWELSLMSGPRLVEGEEAASNKRRADMAWFVDWKKHYSKGACVGTEEANGEMCYRLELTTPEGSEETHFYSVDSGLERAISMTVKHQMGDIPASVEINEYTDFGGLRIASGMIQRAAGMDQVITISSFVKNPDLPADAFAVPEAIKALLPAGGN
ncbi:MAG: hypothetical protein R3E97_02115 [Candidatus Eisenbacteria bacterium]